ncbi:MAG: uracil-DNA glycosylase [Proteobacteria bacterium]|nr:uracil-DNA glycosylase [Pseudomonadota bacterium]
MRDGFVSEKPLNVQPAPKVAAPIVPKPATAPIPKPFTASMPTSITGSLEEIRATLGNCTRCALSKDRKNIVYGVGNPKADLVIVGEAPGRDEDLQGEPFVGAAGQLLTDILKAIGLERSDVYICNVIKCRPPNNRPPETDEIDQCSPFVQAQIDAISPKLICSLGKFATQTLLKTDQSITRLRGRFQDYKGIPLMPTFHPAYLLRNPDAKKDVWEDMKKIHAEYITRTGKDIKRKGK